MPRVRAPRRLSVAQPSRAQRTHEPVSGSGADEPLDWLSTILNGGAGFTVLKKGTGITSVMIEIGLHSE